MAGLLKSELKNGEVYRCRLSKMPIVVEVFAKTNGVGVIGLYHDLNEGYKQIQIFDGQLEKIGGPEENKS